MTIPDVKNWRDNGNQALNGATKQIVHDTKQEHEPDLMYQEETGNARNT